MNRTRCRGMYLAAALWAAAALSQSCVKVTLQDTVPEEAGRLDIIVENFLPGRLAGALRTIAPSQLSTTDLANTAQYTLKLTGTTGRQTLPEQTLALAGGRATLDSIPEGLWELTVTAYNAANTAILQGKAVHRVRQAGSGPVSFTLTPAGLTGTGTLSLTVNYNAQDLAVLQSDTTKARQWRMALYSREDGSMVANTEAVWNLGAGNAGTLPTTLTYNGGPTAGTFNLAAGEYELRFTMSGGGLPAGTTLRWSDNLYIEPGRQTTGTVTIPKLAHKPAVPGGFACVPDANTHCAGHLCWNSVYNAQEYEMEVKTFAAGKWLQFDETKWNSLSGGRTYFYDRTIWKPQGGPGIVQGSGGLLRGDIEIAFSMPRAADRFWTARMRAKNDYGTSAWTYLPCPSPENPHRKDKATTDFTVATTNGDTTSYNVQSITGTQRFNPYGEGLWVFAANWDGGENKYDKGAGGNIGNTIGNEVLLIDWDPVANADYYELEMLLHPNHGLYSDTAEKVANSTKYEKLPTTDTEWETYKARNTLQLAFSGDSSSGNYYRTKTYTYSIPTKAANTRVNFVFLAWRGLAGGKNSGYQVANAAGTSGANSFIGPPDASGLSTRGGTSYRIGLEGNCDALAVLVNSFSPQHWYGIRIRAVNEHGRSDWVYWKGGKS